MGHWSPAPGAGEPHGITGGCGGTARVSHAAVRGVEEPGLGHSLGSPSPARRPSPPLVGQSGAAAEGQGQVVSWPRGTWPLLRSVFNSVRSLAQTYDLCCVWQHHPSPRRTACRSEGRWGSPRALLPPPPPQEPCSGRWPGLAGGQCWGGAAKSDTGRPQPWHPSAGLRARTAGLPAPPALPLSGPLLNFLLTADKSN